LLIKIKIIKKPEETRLIAETSGVASAKEVSNNIITSVKVFFFSLEYKIKNHSRMKSIMF